MEFFLIQTRKQIKKIHQTYFFKKNIYDYSYMYLKASHLYIHMYLKKFM